MLRSLDPILVDGLLRVGGRLSLAPVPFNAKDQIILRKTDNVPKLIITRSPVILVDSSS